MFCLSDISAASHDLNLCVISVSLTVGGLKTKGLKLSTSNNRLRCGGRGGALGTQMNLFDRFARVIKVSFVKYNS